LRIYGRNAVREALRGRRGVSTLWAHDAVLGRAFCAEAGGARPQLRSASAVELERLCGSAAHQGFVAEAEPYPYVEGTSLLEGEQALVVALDRVQDPQNLGAICRSAECAGASGVVVPRHRAADVTPAVCRASAGAVEHLPIARVRNLADFLADAKRSGAWVYGADAAAASSYAEQGYAGRVVLVLGSEGSGLRPRVRAACDVLVSLPLLGRVASLNVSAVAAVLLYEVVRQREDSTKPQNPAG
jgi:23S rRNA (guanosine2251-2'-O)-methyltransferase